MKRWLVLIAAALAVVAAAVMAGILNERRAADAEAAKVEAQQVAAQAQAREAAAVTDGVIKRAVGVQTERAVNQARAVERRGAEVMQEIDRHASAAQPIDPALSRAWVAGLRRLCDDAGRDACIASAAADRTERQPAREPVPAGSPAGR